MEWTGRIQYGQATEITNILQEGFPPGRTWGPFQDSNCERLLNNTQAWQVTKQSIAYVIVLRWKT